MSLYRLNKRREIMLCYPFEEKRLSKWEPPFFVQPKYDGERCRAVKEESGVVLYSSECNEFWSVPHINRALDYMMEGMDVGTELDGELYRHGWDFSSIHSVVSRRENFHPDFGDIHYHIFDIVNVGMVQWMRSQFLLTLPRVGSPIWITPTFPCSTLDEVMEKFDEFTRLGYEGIIIRNSDALYVRRRSTYMMKFKPKKSDIYRVVGYKQEMAIDGTPKDSLGSLLCASDENETFSVGTGLTAEMRKQLWENKHLLMGKLVKVSYQHLSPGRRVPRFPVFVEVLK